MNWWIIVSNGRVSEEKLYISSIVVIIVHIQQPPRSWSTIKIGSHYSPQSLSTAAIRIHHQLPPWSWSITTIRCQHDKGSAIIITISLHDTESGMLDPSLRSLICDPQIIIHDVATAAALDLRTKCKRTPGKKSSQQHVLMRYSFLWCVKEGGEEGEAWKRNSVCHVSQHSIPVAA